MIYIFDADNTLYSTKKAAKEADMAAMQHFSKLCSIPAEQLYEEWLKIIEPLKQDPDPVKRSRKFSYLILGQKHGFDDIEKGYTLFLKKLTGLIKPIDGIKELLESIKETKVIITEDDRTQALAKLNKLNLTEHFKLIITSDDTGYMKPHPSYFELLKKKIKCSYDDMIIIGDNLEKDVEFPKTLGIKAIYFTGDIEQLKKEIRSSLPRSSSGL